MIKSISNSASRKFVEKGILGKDNEEVCSYGLEIFISTIISVCMVLIISIICAKTMEGIIYLIFYCSLRTYAGGYHAKSHRSCILTFLGVYALISVVLHFYMYDFQDTNFLMLVFCNLVVIVFGTVDTVINPFSDSRKKKMHRISIFTMLFHSVIIAGMTNIPELYRMGVYALFGDFVCCVLVTVGFVEKRIVNGRSKTDD